MTYRIKLKPCRFSAPWFIFRNGWKYYSRYGWEIRLFVFQYSYSFYARQYTVTLTLAGFEAEVRWDRLPRP